MEKLPNSSIRSYTFGAFNNSLAVSGSNLNYCEINCNPDRRIFLRRILTKLRAYDITTDVEWSENNALSQSVIANCRIQELPTTKRTVNPPDVVVTIAGLFPNLWFDIPINRQIEFANLSSNLGFRISLEIANSDSAPNPIYYNFQMFAEFQFLTNEELLKS